MTTRIIIVFVLGVVSSYAANVLYERRTGRKVFR